MRTESKHDSLVEEYKSMNAICEPNKSKLSVDVLNSFSTFLNSLVEHGIFIEDEWFPDGPANKRGRRGRPAYVMDMTTQEDPYFLLTGKAPILGIYLNQLNKIFMNGINSIEGGKSLFADLEVPFALLVDSKEEIDKSRVAQGKWLEELESRLLEGIPWTKMEDMDNVFKNAMNSTFVLKYDEIFVQTDIYSNPKEMDDLLAILCLSRMCKKLYLSFDTVAIGANFQKMHREVLISGGWMGHAEVVFLN